MMKRIVLVGALAAVVSACSGPNAVVSSDFASAANRTVTFAAPHYALGGHNLVAPQMATVAPRSALAPAPVPVRVPVPLAPQAMRVVNAPVVHQAQAPTCASPIYTQQRVVCGSVVPSVPVMPRVDPRVVAPRIVVPTPVYPSHPGLTRPCLYPLYSKAGFHCGY